MATVLTVGDIAIVQYNSVTTDAFTFVFLRDVDAGTVVNFTDNGWLAAGGFRPGEGTVTYTAPSAITAGTIVTLPGLSLDDAGDQIIAYQGDPATPTILYVVDLADGNNTVAGDATNDNTTALPPGFTLDSNAVAVAFDNALYAGPTAGSRAELFAAISNSANWISSDALPVVFSARTGQSSISTSTIRRMAASTIARPSRRVVRRSGLPIPIPISTSAIPTVPKSPRHRSGSRVRLPATCCRSSARCRRESSRRPTTLRPASSG